MASILILLLSIGKAFFILLFGLIELKMDVLFKEATHMPNAPNYSTHFLLNRNVMRCLDSLDFVIWCQWHLSNGIAQQQLVQFIHWNYDDETTKIKFIFLEASKNCFFYNCKLFMLLFFCQFNSKFKETTNCQVFLWQTATMIIAPLFGFEALQILNKKWTLPKLSEFQSSNKQI